MFRRYILPTIVYLVYRVLLFTWRVRLIEPLEMVDRLKNREPFVLAHWHGDELVLLHLIGKYRIATIASTSKDGESMNTLIRFVGGVTSRGSSTRGAVQALKGLVRLVQEGHNTSFAVDGPKGPIYKVKPGVFEVSRICKAPIFWSGVYADRAWRFEKSWNKTYLPKPFARVYIEWHGPRPPIEKDQDPRDPLLAESLESVLHAAKHQAAKKFDVHDA